MSNSVDAGGRMEIRRLLRTAATLPEGYAKIGLLEQAVRQADVLGDLDVQYSTRESFVRAATFGGRPDLALIAHAWRLGHSDAHPDKYDQFDLLWQYKWVIHSLVQFPQLTRGQIVAAIEDFDQRAAREGHSRYAAEWCRLKNAREMGDLKSAKEAYERIQNCRRDSLCDCRACVRTDEVRLLADLGDNGGAIREAEPILAGRLRCAEVPHMTLAALLMPYFLLDQLEEAAQCHRRGYRLVCNNPALLLETGEHLAFAAMTGNTARAMDLLGKHLATALETPRARDRFEFLRSSLLAIMCAAREKSKLKLRLPNNLPISRPDGVYSAEDLQQWLRSMADDLAAQFDRRNENTYFRQRLDSCAAMVQMVKPYPLTRKKAKESPESAKMAQEE